MPRNNLVFMAWLFEDPRGHMMHSCHVKMLQPFPLPAMHKGMVRRLQFRPPPLLTFRLTLVECGGSLASPRPPMVIAKRDSARVLRQRMFFEELKPHSFSSESKRNFFQASIRNSLAIKCGSFGKFGQYINAILKSSKTSLIVSLSFSAPVPQSASKIRWSVSNYPCHSPFFEAFDCAREDTSTKIRANDFRLFRIYLHLAASNLVSFRPRALRAIIFQQTAIGASFLQVQLVALLSRVVEKTDRTPWFCENIFIRRNGMNNALRPSFSIKAPSSGIGRRTEAISGIASSKFCSFYYPAPYPYIFYIFGHKLTPARSSFIRVTGR